MVRVGIIGLGHWGPNLKRIIGDFSDSEITAICDLSDDRLNVSNNSTVFKTKNANELIDKRIIDAVIIATPTNTHYPLAKLALERGIHAFVEKPLATKSFECEELINIAKDKKLILFVGHVFLYNNAVNTMKKLIDDGELGKVIHINASRLNLGPVRQDVNALWDLAPHDISIILELLGRLPRSVNCQGLAFLKPGVHDVCSLTMNFEDNCMATIHVSWLDPNKTRLMTIVGDKKMAVFDDNEQLEKIKVFDKSVNGNRYTNGSYEDFQFSNRYGDTWIPWLNLVEPLKAECHNFLECVIENKVPKSDGKNGMDVVRVLEAADISLQNGGGKVTV